MERDDEYVAYVSARYSALYRLALVLCGDQHRAEDIVQSALLKAYTAWPRVARAGIVDAYVRRIVVNSHIDEQRRPWRREQPLTDESITWHDDAPGLRFEEADEMWAAVRRLPAGQRRVVVLRHFWGLSVDETAADLGISPGTVKSQTSDAITRLRNALGPLPTTGGTP